MCPLALQNTEKKHIQSNMKVDKNNYAQKAHNFTQNDTFHVMYGHNMLRHFLVINYLKI